jgi:hypothetical protein
MGVSYLSRLTSFVALAVFVTTAPTFGKIFVVNNPEDSQLPNSLRGAVLAANQTKGDDVIIIRVPICELSLQGPRENSGSSGDIDILPGGVTIIGATSNVVIDARRLHDRVFQVLPGASLTIANLTITGGSCGEVRKGPGRSGGAIYNAGRLTARNCRFINNASGSGASHFDYEAPGGEGGAICNTGYMMFYNCAVSLNWCHGDRPNGGGIFNSGTATLANCTVDRNAAGWIDGDYAFGSGGNGGGIFNTGTLKITHCQIVQNQTVPGYYGAGATGNGGGIFNTGRLTVSESLIQQNFTADAFPSSGSFWETDAGSGGGICNFGVLRLNQCTISSNRTGAGSSNNAWPGRGMIGGSGAGIYNMGELLATNSTFNANSTGPGGDAIAAPMGGIGGDGGAIYNGSNTVLVACTISGNSTGHGGFGSTDPYSVSKSGNGGSGGGIFSSGVLVMRSCTIALNATGYGAPGVHEGNYYVGGDGGNGGSGGGIFCFPQSVLSIANTVVALNVAGRGGIGGTGEIWGHDENGYQVNVGPTNGINGLTGSGPDIAGEVSSQGFNLIGKVDGSIGIFDHTKGDIFGTTENPIDPMIAPLAITSGKTPIHQLLQGSPAIDQGHSFGDSTDQQGKPRTVDISSIPNATGGDGTDIGAVEVQ